ncbi:MAG: hypothetical protein ACTIJJ_12685 [Galactobacter sp.]
MSTTTDPGRDRHQQQRPTDRRRQSANQDTRRRGREPAQETAPEAIRAARVTQRNRGMNPKSVDDVRRARGVEWVRPTDLLARQSATLAGRGIEFEVELARRTRKVTGDVTRASGRGLGKTAQAISGRARRLPDVSEFGRGSRHQSWVSRSGIGLG